MATGLGNKLKTANIREIMATRARSVFSYRINFSTIGYNNVSKMKEWCETNCNGIWRSETHYALYFQFELEKDATMFMLRWATADGNKLK